MKRLWNNVTFMLLLQLCIPLAIITTTHAFRCYVCDSKDDIECTENMPTISKLVSQDCKNITGAKYCIKTTNIYAGKWRYDLRWCIKLDLTNELSLASGEFGTKRFCAANDHGSYCKYIKQPTGDREYRSCVLTCDSENCNGAVALFDRHNNLYVGPFLILLSYIWMTTPTCNQYSITWTPWTNIIKLLLYRFLICLAEEQFVCVMCMQ